MRHVVKIHLSSSLFFVWEPYHDYHEVATLIHTDTDTVLTTGVISLNTVVRKQTVVNSLHSKTNKWLNKQKSPTARSFCQLPVSLSPTTETSAALIGVEKRKKNRNRGIQKRLQLCPNLWTILLPLKLMEVLFSFTLIFCFLFFCCCSWTCQQQMQACMPGASNFCLLARGRGARWEIDTYRCPAWPTRPLLSVHLGLHPGLPGKWHVHLTPSVQKEEPAGKASFYAQNHILARLRGNHRPAPMLPGEIVKDGSRGWTPLQDDRKRIFFFECFFMMCTTLSECIVSAIEGDRNE